MTNAEKIRTMTDEELAEGIARIADGGMEWFSNRACNLCQAEHGGKCPTGESDGCPMISDSDIMSWLKAPADE